MAHLSRSANVLLQGVALRYTAHSFSQTAELESDASLVVEVVSVFAGQGEAVWRILSGQWENRRLVLDGKRGP